jgi:hypothetical protein
MRPDDCPEGPTHQFSETLDDDAPLQEEDLRVPDDLWNTVARDDNVLVPESSGAEPASKPATPKVGSSAIATDWDWDWAVAEGRRRGSGPG